MMKSSIMILGLLASLSQINGRISEKKLLPKSSNDNEICAIYPNWAMFPHPESCHKFYVCSDKVLEEYKCAQNYYFNRVELRCLPGNCIHQESTLQMCDKPLEVQRVDGDCTSFSVCVNASLEQMSCPYGNYYDMAYHSCQPVTNNARHKCSCIMPEYTALANSEDCETYYMCIGGEAVLQQCPRGQYFDEQISSCLTDSTGVCLMAPTMSSAELSMQSICEHAGHLFQPNQDDCGKFYICLNGRVFTKECPEGQIFDRVWSHCREDTKNECKAKKVPEMMTIEEHKTTNKEDHDKLLPNWLKKKEEHDEKKQNVAKEHKVQLLIDTPKVEVERPQNLDSESVLEIQKPKEFPPKVEVELPAREIKESQDSEDEQDVREEEVVDVEDIIQKKEAIKMDVVSELESLEDLTNDVATLQETVTKLESTSSGKEAMVPPAQAMTPQKKPPTESAYDKLASKFITFS